MAFQQSPNLLKYQYLYMPKFFPLFSFAGDRNTDTKPQMHYSKISPKNVCSHSHIIQHECKNVGE